MEQRRLFQGPPSLPSEIWLRIFGMATRLPDDLIVAPPYRIEACPHYTNMSIDRGEVTNLKLSLVLVCHSWRQMATQFLYEIIYMKLCGGALGFKRVEALLSIFKTSASSDELHSVEHGYGRWVKQLTFRTESLSVAYVAAVVGHCPNLCTLIIDNTPKWKEAKIHSILLPAIPASLRRMKIHGIWSGNTTQNLGTVLRKCPSIRAATLVCMERKKNLIVCPR
jgi:hypothetical protein